MKAEVLAPGMQDGRVPDRCSQILFICGQFLKRFRHAPKKKIIAVPLVTINQEIELLRDSKYHVKIVYVQEISLSGINPPLLRKRLTLGTMSVTAGIVGRFFIATVRASVHMPAEPGCPAAPDGVHSFMLSKGQTVMSSIGICKLLENILYLRHRLLPSACGHTFSAEYPTDF